VGIALGALGVRSMRRAQEARWVAGYSAVLRVAVVLSLGYVLPVHPG
jgi:hypothetical protein